jgi:hypothetical protein
MLCLPKYLSITMVLVSVGFVTACGSSSESDQKDKAGSQLDGGGTSSDGGSTTPTQDAASSDTAGAACNVDGDCRTFENTCGTCSCKALGKTEPDPTCSKQSVSCFAPSCTDSIALCRNKRCVVAPRCKTDGDCRLIDNYCGGCACDARGKTEADPKCSSELAQCGPASPCAEKEPWCDLGKCSARGIDGGRS